MAGFGSNRNALAQYAAGAQQPERNDGHSPHELIKMLFEGGIKNINIAKSCLQHGNIEGKGIHTSKALDIIGLLRSSLNHDVDSVLPSMLLQTYDYLEYRLLEANLLNDKRMFAEAIDLLTEIKSGWDEIGDVENPAALTERVG